MTLEILRDGDREEVEVELEPRPGERAASPDQGALHDLAEALREEVLPHLGAHAAREHSGEAEGGDVTFAIDERAEARMEAFLAERAPNVAFYSEDRGMVSPAGGDAEWVLVVDPIDGTRPALAGFESSLRLGRRGPAGRRADDGRRRGRRRGRAEERQRLRRRARHRGDARAGALREHGDRAHVLGLRPARPPGPRR